MATSGRVEAGQDHSCGDAVPVLGQGGHVATGSHMGPPAVTSDRTAISADRLRSKCPVPMLRTTRSMPISITGAAPACTFRPKT